MINAEQCCWGWHTGDYTPCVLMSDYWAMIKTLKKEGEKDRESKGGRGKRERAIVCSPLPPCFLLHSSENDISSPPKELLFSSTLRSLLLFKLLLVFPSCVRFPSWWNYLFCLMCHHAHHITLNHVQTHYTYNWIICMCFSGCYRITNWRDFLMMLHGTYPTYCPCESLSYTDTNHATEPHVGGNEQSPGHPPTHLSFNRSAGVE